MKDELSRPAGQQEAAEQLVFWKARAPTKAIEDDCAEISGDGEKPKRDRPVEVIIDHMAPQPGSPRHSCEQAREFNIRLLFLGERPGKRADLCRKQRVPSDN